MLYMDPVFHSSIRNSRKGRRRNKIMLYRDFFLHSSTRNKRNGRESYKVRGILYLDSFLHSSTRNRGEGKERNKNTGNPASTRKIERRRRKELIQYNPAHE